MLSLAAPEAAAQTRSTEAPTLSTDQNCRGGVVSGNFEIGVVVDTEEFYTVVMTDMTTGVELANSRRDNLSSATTQVNNGCQCYAYFDGMAAGVPGSVQFLKDRLYRIDMFPTDPSSNSDRASFYDSHSSNCVAGSSVFCPSGELGGSPDVVFFIGQGGIGTYPAQLGLFGVGASIEGILGDDWVMPYDVTRYCARAPSRCPGPEYRNGVPRGTNLMFLAPVPYGSGPSTLPIPLRPVAQADWRVPMGQTYTWSSTDVSQILFGSGGRLVVNGGLNVTGVSLSAGQGWNGLTVPGGTLSLGTGSEVSGVASNSGAVVVTAGGRVTLDGASISNTVGGAGLYVTGSGSDAYVTGASKVFNNTAGPGIRVDAGGSVLVSGDAVEIYGNAEGIRASGAGSLATVYGALVRNNDGPGARATANARVEMLRLMPTPGDPPPNGVTSFVTAASLPIRLVQNVGGLYTGGAGKQPGGVVTTEGLIVCVQQPCPPSPLGQNEFRQNNLGPAFDASARTGSQVLATYNYWGTDQRGLIEIQEDDPGSVQIDPVLTAPPGGSAAVAARAGRDTPQTAGKGRVEEGVQALITEADRATQAADSTLAGAHLLSAWARGTTDDDRLAVAEAAARTLLRARPAALVAWAETAAASEGADRPWGRRARALALVGQGRLGDAASVARSLADEDGAGAGETAEAHRARGLALLVGIAVADRDGAGALAALNALAAVDPEGAEDALLPVAVAFPDLDLTLALGRISAGDGAPVASKTTGATPSAERFVSEFSVRPNPSSGAVRVSLVLAEASDVRVAVFDALGREVALLHEGSASPGALGLPLDGASLPAGVYVVRATVRGAAGASVLARTVTVAR